MWGWGGTVHLEHNAETEGTGRTQEGGHRSWGRTICAEGLSEKRSHIGLCLHERGARGKRDHLTKQERWLRYPAQPGNSYGTGKYLLEVQNGRLYLDALKQGSDFINGIDRVKEGSCGIGGKVNTNPGNQNAHFKGSKICAIRKIHVGEEIFAPYTYGGSYKLLDEHIDEERSGWCVFKGKRFYRDMG